MKLSYRGIQYNQDRVSLEADVTQTTGRYRGEEYKISSSIPRSAKRNNSSRTYRGVNY